MKLSKDQLKSLYRNEGELNKLLSTKLSPKQEKYLTGGLLLLLHESKEDELNITYEKKDDRERISLFEPFHYMSLMGYQSFSAVAWEVIEDGFVLYEGESNGNTPFECDHRVCDFNLDDIRDFGEHFVKTLD